MVFLYISSSKQVYSTKSIELFPTFSQRIFIQKVYICIYFSLHHNPSDHNCFCPIDIRITPYDIFLNALSNIMPITTATKIIPVTIGTKLLHFFSSHPATKPSQRLSSVNDFITSNTPPEGRSWRRLRRAAWRYSAIGWSSMAAIFLLIAQNIYKGIAAAYVLVNPFLRNVSLLRNPRFRASFR